jgi:ABC-type nickel/cobalt efflux system permease component RcnA
MEWLTPDELANYRQREARNVTSTFFAAQGMGAMALAMIAYGVLWIKDPGLGKATWWLPAAALLVGLVAYLVIRWNHENELGAKELCRERRRSAERAQLARENSEA